jgi:Chlorophyllase enzyme
MSTPQPRTSRPNLSSVVSIKPIILPAPDRGVDLQARVTAPTTGSELPVVIFSHGFGESMDGYAPLAEFWAEQGFVVVQPTHLDSQVYGIVPGDPRTPEIWRFRIQDLKSALDGLDVIEEAVPGLSGRVDRSRIAVAGHSWGATTASALIGARVIDADGNTDEDFADPRITAGVLLALAGTGGENLTPFAAEHFAFMNPSFDHMTTPTLFVVGDQDQSPLSVRGPDWWTDAYTLSPTGKALLTLFGAEHTMGGIAGYSTHETTDWSFERITLIQQVTTAYLRSAVGPKDNAWSVERADLADTQHALGRVESR